MLYLNKFVKFAFFWIFLVCQMGSLQAADCEQVSRVDKKINFDGALVAFLGCQKLNQEVIRKLQNHSDPLISIKFTNLYYSGVFQPTFISSEDQQVEIDKALSEKRLSSFAYVDLWVDSNDPSLREITINDFKIEDEETYEIFSLIIAAYSLYWHEMNFAWAFPEIDSVALLKKSGSIPFVADYLSYAYANGVLVRVDIEKSNEYFDIAKDTLAEAVRYKGITLMDQGAALNQSLEYFRDAADMNYVPAILDLAETLHDQSNTSTVFEREYQELFSLIEDLGYLENYRAQRLLAISYEGGTGVDENIEVAKEWYRRAAANGDTDAASNLMTYLAREGNYKEYSELALKRATQLGAVEGDGYLEAILGIYASDKPEKTKLKLIQFILDHCKNNPWVSEDAINICENYPVPEVEFEPGQDLFAGLRDPQSIKFKNELKLPTGNYYALVIGNEDYEYWPSLKTPKNDINAVSALLADEYSFNVRKITDASRKEILTEIYNLGSKAEFNDHVLLYYAGHGVVDEETNEGYWIPTSADQSFRPDWVSNSEIKTALKSIKARHLLVMADSCYSGTLVRAGVRLQSEISNPVIKRLFSKKARVAITSGGNEPVVDSVSGADNSVFANAFLDVLNGNVKNFLPASIVFTSIRDKVTKEANQTPVYANIRELDDDGGEFVFKKTD